MESKLNKIKNSYRSITLLKAIYIKFRHNRFLRQFIKFFKRYPYFFRDIKNKIKYGKQAPIYAERIWVNPLKCKKLLIINETRKKSGLILKSWPYDKAVPIIKRDKIRFCIEHWVKGIPWKDTGVYEYIERLIKKYGSYDNCKN